MISDGERAPPSQASGATIWTRTDIQGLLGQWKEESAWQIPVQEGIPPGGMLNRVDIGAYPSNRWYGVIMMPQPLGGLALRAALQAVRKVRWSFPSSSMAFTSRCWMSLVWDCWVEPALEAPLDSASLMVVEQWFSASAKASKQSSSISLRKVACWTLASLISAVPWVSASQMVQAQRAFTSLMASIVSDSN